MSKLFSISLATMMMLMSLMGSVQPITFMDEPSPDINPVLEEIPANDPQDGDEATQVEEPLVTEPTEETSLPDEDSHDLVPIEVPEENANAPPADDVEETAEVQAPVPVVTDEPVETESEDSEISDPAPVVTDEPETNEDEAVVEDNTPDLEEESVVVETPVEIEAPVVESVSTDDETGTEDADSLVISPNAVDPDPKPCPIDEACDGGGGGEQPQAVTVTITVKQPFQVSQGAFVVVRDSANIEAGSAETGVNGTVQFELNVGETYTVDVTKTGFTPRTGVSLTVSADSPSLNIILTPLWGKITVSVTDSVTNEPVTYAIVRFTKKPGTLASVNTNSGSTGVITPSLESGDYVAFFSKDGYVSKQFDVTIVVGDSIQVQLDPKVEEPVTHTLSVLLLDSDTGEPIPESEVSLRNPQTWAPVAQGTTNQAGEWTSPPVENIQYRFTIVSPYHRTHSTILTEIPSGVITVEVDRLPAGSLTVNLTDVDTGEPVGDALVTIVDEHSGIEAASGRTNAEGNWSSGSLPGASYIFTFQADGYQTYTTTIVLLSDHTWNISMMPPGYAGSMFVWVWDDDSSEDIVGATITAKNGDVTETFTTDEDGFSGELSLAPGTWEVTVTANGYQPYTEEIEVKSGRDVDVYAGLEPRPGANLTIQLQAPMDSSALLMTNVGMASGPGLSGPTVYQVPGAVQPVVGAMILVVNPDTGLVTNNGVTGVDGLVTLSVARQGTYQLIVNVEGYQTYSAPFELNDDAEHLIMLQPIVVDDPGTGNPGEGIDPGTDNPVEGTDPGTGNPDEGTNPDSGNGSDSDTGNTDNGTTPGIDEPIDSSNPGAGSEPGQSIDDGAGENGSAGSDEVTDSEAIAQSSGTTTDGSTARVSGLPNTGAGDSGSSTAIAAITLVAAFTLLSALGIRRKA